MSQGVYLTQMDRIDKYEHKKVYFLSSFLKKKKNLFNYICFTAIDNIKDGCCYCEASRKGFSPSPSQGFGVRCAEKRGRSNCETHIPIG